MPYSLTLLDDKITTTSGDIIAQFSTISGGVSEEWVNNNFADYAEITTISGDIIAQIGAGEVTLEQLTTTSGDIVDQIPSLTGYATEAWVSSQDYVTENTLTTTSGDIIEQFTEYAAGTHYHTKPYIVDVAVSGTEYDSIQDAIDSITVADYDLDWYVVRVFPGIYYEDVVLKDNVNIVGVDLAQCLIEGSVSWPASENSEEGWSSLLNIGITAYPTTSGFNMITVEQGYHDINNCWLYLEPDGVAAKMVYQTGGWVHTYLAEYEYYQTGETDGTDPHIIYRLQQGELEEQVAEIYMTVEDSAADMVGYCMTCSGGVTAYKGIGTKVYMTATNGSFSGNAIMLRNFGDSDVEFSAGLVHLSGNTGGNGICYWLDSEIVSPSGLGIHVYSHATRYKVEDFNINNSFYVPHGNDLLSSHYDLLDCSDGILGSHDHVESVHSESPGTLHLTGAITIGNGLDLEQDLMEFDIGEVSNPTVKYSTDPYGHRRLQYRNPLGNAGFYNTSVDGASFIASEVTGTDARDHRATFALINTTDINDTDTIRNFSMTMASGNQEYQIRSIWDGIDKGVLLGLDEEGLFRLKSGVQVDEILDEDSFASDSATSLATQQSIKAYVGNQDDAYYANMLSHVNTVSGNIIGYVDAYTAPANSIVVTISGGSFNSIQAAIDSVTDATEDNAYVIEVHPGTYIENIYMKDWVSVAGQGIGITNIVGNVYFQEAYGITASGGASMRDVSVKNTFTTPGNSLITIDTGENTFALMMLETIHYGAGNTIVTISGGTVLFYNSRAQITAPIASDGSTPNRMFYHGGGAFYYAVSQTIGISYDDNADFDVLYSDSDATGFAGIYFTTHDYYSLSPSCSGNLSVFKFSSASTASTVKNSVIHFNSAGGNETVCGYYIDSELTTQSGGKIHSSNNSFWLPENANTYYNYVGNNDTFVSNFDETSAEFERLGNQSNQYIVYTEADGVFRVTDGIEIGRQEQSEITLIRVDTADDEDDSPRIFYYQNPYGYQTLAWTTASGNTAFISESLGDGETSVTAITKSPNAFDYRQGLDVGAMDSDTDELRIYGWTREADDRLLLERQFSLWDGGSPIELIGITPSGLFNLRYGTTVDRILDENNFASDSATALATQQSIKAYVDSSGGASIPYVDNLVTTTSGDLVEYTDESITTYSGYVVDTYATQNDISDLDYLFWSDIDRQSSGLLSGGWIETTGSGYTFMVGSGTGYINKGTGEAGSYIKISWDDIVDQSPAGNGHNYLAIDENGDLDISVEVQQSTQDYIYLGAFYRSPSPLQQIGPVWNTPSWISDYPRRNTSFIRDAFGTIISEGFSVSTYPAPSGLNLYIASGKMYIDLTPFEFEATDEFTMMFKFDPGYATYTGCPNTVSTEYWNNVENPIESALVTMTSGYWKKDLLVMNPVGRAYYAFGTDEYATQEEAQAASLPEYAGILAADGNAFLYSIVVQQGATSLSGSFYDIRPNFSRIFGSESITAGGGSLISYNDLVDKPFIPEDVDDLEEGIDYKRYPVAHYTLVANIPTMSGELVAYTDSIDQANRSWTAALVNTTSGDIVDWTQELVTTCSGDLVAQMGGGSIDHGSLQGLTADDHPQYGHLAQNETISGNWTVDTKLKFTNYTNSSPVDGDRWKQSDNDFRVRSNSTTFVDAVNSMIQCKHLTGTSTIECNSTQTAITWNVEDIKDSIYTHSTTIDPDRITVGATAWYKITYSVGWESQDALKKNIGVSVIKNGLISMCPSQSYAQAQNNKDGKATNYNSFMCQLTSGDYIQVMASGVGSTGSALTLQNGACHVSLEFLRWSS